MRLNKLWKWLLLAAAAALVVRHRRRRAARLSSGVRRRRRRDREPDVVREAVPIDLGADLGDDLADDLDAEQDAERWPGSRDLGEESVQAMDEAGGFRVEPLAVAFSDQDLDVIEDVDIIDADLLVQDLGPSDVRADLHKPSDDVDWRASPDADPVAVAEGPSGDAGELYGVHVVPAANTDLPNNDTSFNEGENWIEALEHTAAEDGPAPERELDLMDTQDEPPHHTDHRDIPVADRGSAGPRGL
jgi:hypothetical protein